MLTLSSVHAAISRIVLAYMAVAGLWIWWSDALLEKLVIDPASFARWSMLKGWLFVAVTAALLALLLRGEFRRREAARLELEIRVAERTADLANAKCVAEASDHLKTAFLATMSHEFRTPLNSIIGFTGVVLQGMAGPLTDEQRIQLGMASDSARHLLALVNDVLDVARIESGRLLLAYECYEMPGVIERAAGMMRAGADRKRLAFSVSVEPGLPVMHGDARRVEQVLINLMSNAVKFTNAGSVEVTVAKRTDAGIDGVEVRVSDTGVGIRPEDLELIFEPFRQVDSTFSRLHEGTGLGLAICRRLLEAMGGSIEVRSKPGAGSEFSVVVPVDTRAVKGGQG